VSHPSQRIYSAGKTRREGGADTSCMFIRKDIAAFRSTQKLELDRPLPEKQLHKNFDTFRSAIEEAKQPNIRPLADLLPQRLGADRTEKDAIHEATELLLGGELERDSNGATVTRDAPHVNDADDTDPKDDRYLAAQAQVDANAELEAAALAELTKEERAQYDAVKQACIDADDPVAQLALQKMLFEGKLPGPTDLAGEGDTLDHLAALADPNTPLAQGVDRGALVTDLVQELATPSAIAQRGKGTCAPTAIAIQLAIQNPAEYARIVAGLAGPDGEVLLAGGQTLQREPGTEVDDGSGRSQVQRLMAPAFMEMANGDENYTNRTDAGRGAWADELDELYEQIWGRPMSAEVYGTDATPEEQAAAMETMDDVLRAGGMVPMAVEYGTGLHKVLVTGTETIDGEEYVKYINPWGREERMLRSEFEGRVVDISWDPAREQVGEVLEFFQGERGELQQSGADAGEPERRRRAMIPV